MHKVSVSVNGQYRPVAGDFDGDGRTEILWYAPGSTADYLWEWNGDGWASHGHAPSTAPTSPWSATSTATTSTTCSGTPPARAGDYYWYGNSNGSFTSVATTINGTYTPARRRPRRQRRRRPVLVRQGHAPPTSSGTRRCSRGGYSSRATTRERHLHALHRRLRRQRHRRPLLVRPGQRRPTSSGTRTAPRASYTSVARTVEQQLRARRRRLRRQRRRRHRVVLAEHAPAATRCGSAPPGATTYSSSTVHSG